MFNHPKFNLNGFINLDEYNFSFASKNKNNFLINFVYVIFLNAHINPIKNVTVERRAIYAIKYGIYSSTNDYKAVVKSGYFIVKGKIL